MTKKKSTVDAMPREGPSVAPPHINSDSNNPKGAEAAAGGKRTADSARGLVNPSEGPTAWRTASPYRRAHGRRGGTAGKTAYASSAR
jgi:hypothetical protein